MLQTSLQRSRRWLRRRWSCCKDTSVDSVALLRALFPWPSLDPSYSSKSWTWYLMISQTKDDDVKPDDSGLVSGSGMRTCCSTATDARISRLGARRFCRLLTDLLPLPETSKFPSRRHLGQFHPSCLGWTRRVMRTVALENLSSGPVTVRQVTTGASLTWSDHVQNLPEYLRIPQKLP